MSEILKTYKAFLDAIKEDPYDKLTHLAFADFLEEQGMDDDAAEQRAWTKEKQQAEDYLHKLAIELRMSWGEFLKEGKELATGQYYFDFDDGPMIMRGEWETFRDHWETFTGSKVDVDQDDTHFSCGC